MEEVLQGPEPGQGSLAFLFRGVDPDAANDDVRLLAAAEVDEERVEKLDLNVADPRLPDVFPDHRKALFGIEERALLLAGRRELIAPLCQQAMDLGFDGLIVESHCDPDSAWSDAKQQVTPDVLDYILSLLQVRSESVTTEGISQLRHQIDDLDNQLMELLSKRMRVCREIGQYKKEHNMTVLQSARYNEILEKRGAQGTLCGMDADFVAHVYELIHGESVRQQIEIVNKN